MNRIEKEYNGVKITAEKFTGINDFLNAYENKPVSEEYKKHTTANELQNETYDSSRKKFTGVKGYTEALDQFKNGKNVAAIKAARTAAESGMKRQIKKSVNGGRVSVPSYLSGSPKCMRRTCKMPAKAELNIVIDMCVSCKITSSQIVEAGKEIVRYITELEYRYNVNLIAANAISMEESGGKYKDAYICGIKIKDAGKPFSAARVSFCLTSAAFLRVFGFMWITRAEGVPFDWGLGHPTSLKSEQETEIMKAVYRNAVTISINDVIRYGEHAFPKMK